MNHISVLKKEVIENLKINPDGVYVDLTLGGGGHSLEILNNLKNGTLIAFDVDPESISNFHTNRQAGRQNTKFESIKLDDKDSKISMLETADCKLVTVNDNFEKLEEYLQKLNIKNVDGIIADLGWSSDQLGNIQGLSFEHPEQELDMRLNQELGVKAKDLLNGLGERELKKMFETGSDIYGSENRLLVSEIIKIRKQKIFESVADLTVTIDKSIAKNKFNKFSYYAKVFQALRVAVNQEKQVLLNMLGSGMKMLKTGGILEVITFHSGESDIVESYIQDNKKFIEIQSKNEDKNYIQPKLDELKTNIRSRSAKLFVIKKI